MPASRSGASRRGRRWRSARCSGWPRERPVRRARGAMWRYARCSRPAAALPWFVPFVMPDIFAPVAVLCFFLLGWGRFRWPVLLPIGALAGGGRGVAPGPSGRRRRLPGARAGAAAAPLAPVRRPACRRLGLAGRQQPGRQRRSGRVALRFGFRPRPAPGGRPGDGLPPQRVPGGRLPALRLGRQTADGQRRLPVGAGRSRSGAAGPDRPWSRPKPRASSRPRCATRPWRRWSTRRPTRSANSAVSRSATRWDRNTCATPWGGCCAPISRPQRRSVSWPAGRLPGRCRRWRRRC